MKIEALPPSRYDVTRAELAELLTDEPRYRADQVWDGINRQGLDVDDLTNVPLPLRRRLNDELPPALALDHESRSDDGETIRSLWRLRDGATVESVLMHYPDRTTVCVSSQAGCAMGCGFCATGQVGFDRHLGVGEILEQVIRARRAADKRLSNVVFMGMGEPFANYDRTWSAIERIHSDLGISARNITVSTVGLVPGIDKLSTERLPVTLAVSLHAANDELRDSLVPINRRYPLSDLMAACTRYLDAKGRRLSFEWALMAGVNDRTGDAAELAGLCADLRAHVNLIPLNPTAGFSVPGTDADGVRRFRDELRRRGVNATVRRNRGTDIDAACGQLRARRVGVSGPTTRNPRPRGEAAAVRSPTEGPPPQ